MLSCKIHLILLIYVCVSLCTQLHSSGKTLAVQIHSVNIPAYVELSAPSFILDCDYSYDLREDERLAVRWFKNKDTEPFYQWLPELQSRHHADWIKPFIEEQFVAPQSSLAGQQRQVAAASQSDSINRSHTQSASQLTVANSSSSSSYIKESDPYKKYRALKITKVHPLLTGSYTCIVSSLAGQDQRHGHVIVFAPPKVFTFEHKFELPTTPTTDQQQHQQQPVNYAGYVPMGPQITQQQPTNGQQQQPSMSGHNNYNNNNNWWLAQSHHHQQQQQQPHLSARPPASAAPDMSHRPHQWPHWPVSTSPPPSWSPQHQRARQEPDGAPAGTNGFKRVIYSHDGRQVMWLDDSPVPVPADHNPATRSPHEFRVMGSQSKQQQRRKRRQSDNDSSARQQWQDATVINANQIVNNNGDVTLDETTQQTDRRQQQQSYGHNQQIATSKQHKLECKAKQITPRPILILLVQRAPNGPFEFVRNVNTQISPYYMPATSVTATNATTSNTTNIATTYNSNNNNQLQPMSHQQPTNNVNNKELGTPFFDITLSAVIQLSPYNSATGPIGPDQLPGAHHDTQEAPAQFEIVPAPSGQTSARIGPNNQQQQQQHPRMPMILPYRPNEQLTFECRLEITGTEHEQRKRLTLSTNELYVSISGNQPALQPFQQPNGPATRYPQRGTGAGGAPGKQPAHRNDQPKQLESAYHSSSSAPRLSYSVPTTAICHSIVVLLYCCYLCRLRHQFGPNNNND